MTPLTEEEVRGIRDATYHDSNVKQLCDEWTAQRRRIAELEAWKESAMKVMPDFQTIGRLIGVPLGLDVSDKIIPGIESLIERIAELEAALREFADSHEHTSDCYGYCPRQKAKRLLAFSNETKKPVT